MNNKREIYVIMLIIFTEILGFSLILPFLPYFATDLGASPLLVGIILATFSFAQFLSAPIIGKLSDKYGRKPLLFISQFSTFLGFLILAFANSIELIFLSRIIDGLFGSNLTVSRAYLGDITDKEEQTKMFGYTSAIFGIGFFIGPAIGGYLATINYAIPSLLAASIALITLILIVFVLEETVDIDKANLKPLTINDIIPLRDIIIVFLDRNFRSIFMIYFGFVFAHTLLTSNLALFSEYQLLVGPEIVGLFLMVVGLVRIIFQTTAFPALVNRYSRSFLLTIGLILLFFANIQFIFVESYIIMALLMAIFSIGSGITRPTLTSEISEKSSIQNRGKYMGVADSLQSLSQIVTPLIGGWIIENTIPGYIGVLAAIIMIPLIFISIRNVLNNSYTRYIIEDEAIA